VKVRYRIRLTGELKFSDEPIIEFDSWRFEFLINSKTGFAKFLIVEVNNVAEEFWPKLIAVEQDPNAEIPSFPFHVQAGASNFHQEIERHLISLESYLSVFGLGSFEFQTIEQEWLPGVGEKNISLMSKFSEQLNNEHPNESISSKEFACLVVASNGNVVETAMLAHFRVAQEAILRSRFLDSMRHSFFCLEYRYGNGKTKNKSVGQEFKKSTELATNINEVLFRDDYRPLKRVVEKYPENFKKITVEEYIDFIISIRGKIQHANTHLLKVWHPSHDHNFLNEAMCLMKLVDEICWNLVMEKVESIKNQKPGKD